MKRIMTFVGALIGTVFTAIYSLIMLIGITAIFEMLSDLDGAPGTGLIAVVSLLLVIAGVLALVFNAIAIGAFNCSAEKYVKKRSLLICAVVFNFLLAALLLISMIGNFTAFALIVFLASIAAGILIIVDFGFEDKRIAAEQPAIAEQHAVAEQPVAPTTSESENKPE